MDNAEFGLAPLFRESRPYGVFSLLFFVAVACLLFVRFDITAAFTLVVALGLFLAGAAYSVWFFFTSARQTRWGVASPRLGLAAIGLSVMGSVLLEAATIFGSPASSVFSRGDWSKKELIVFFVACMAVVVSVLSKRSRDHGALARSDRGSTSLRSILMTMPGCFAVVACLDLMAAGGVWAIAGFSFASTERAVFLACCLVIAGMFCALYSKWAPGHPEYLFVSLGLSLGLFLCVSLPPLTAISPDDQIHYARSLGLSYLGDAQYTSQEVELFTVPWVENSVLQFDEIEEVVVSADADYERDVAAGRIMRTPGFHAAVSSESLLNISSIGYIPSAIGLWLARLLHLPLLLGVVCGRTANLLCYIAVVAAAIRITPIKKHLMCLIGLLPTSLYLASNYSYDPWVTSFLMLATALTLRACSKPEEPISFSMFLTCVLAFGVGLAPKAVYCPLIGLMFLIPSSRFASRRAHRRYLCWVIAFGIVMALSFILPMLFSSAAQVGDLRGGEGVNAAGQIGYIVAHPFEYLRTLATFVLNYISPTASDAYSINYAYMGSLSSVSSMFSAVASVLLFSVAASERNAEASVSIPRGGRTWAMFVFTLCVVLVSTSLYVSFTPVGSTDIAGVQGRYLLPLLYCVLAPMFCPTEKGGVRPYVKSRGRVVPMLVAVVALSILMDAVLVVPW